MCSSLARGEELEGLASFLNMSLPERNETSTRNESEIFFKMGVAFKPQKVHRRKIL
jgi:hypothetical protein